MSGRNSILLRDIDRSARILEIGASFSPVAPKRDGWNCIVVDHASRSELIEKYRAHPGVDINSIEEVDYVWTGGSLQSALPRDLAGAFDLCIASHVIEHIPDLISFLESVAVLVKPSGTMAVAVPDKRYCFDYFQPLSTTGEVLTAHAECRVKHPPRAVFDHFAYAIASDDAIAWGQHPVGIRQLRHSLQEAQLISRQADGAASAPYIDVHTWRFTPAHFELVLFELACLKATDWKVRSMTQTVGCEFITTLELGGVSAATQLSPLEVNERRLTLLERALVELSEQVDYLRAGPRRPGVSWPDEVSGATSGDSTPAGGAIEKELRRLRNELSRVTRERDIVLASSSWRMTAPLRRFAAYARRIRPAPGLPTNRAATNANTNTDTNITSHTFTAHNIRLDDGSLTKPDAGGLLADGSWFLSVKRLLETIYPEGLKGKRIADLGCLEGGYTVEFARMGMDALGLEVRPNNFANCLYVKEHTSLPNLQFVNDDAWNIKNYGTFDIIFCCGLLYHLDRPVAFVRMLSDLCRKGLILNTHFAATAQDSSIHPLGELTEHEGVAGRWYSEYDPGLATQSVTELKWASWSNPKSFWIRREHLLGLLRDTGFQLVFEQFDFLDGPLGDAILDGFYAKQQRGVFVGLKCGS